MFFIGISIPFIGILLIIFFGLSNTRNMFIYQFHTKRKERHSLHPVTNVSKNSYLTIDMNPFTSNIITIPLEDDEDLMKCDILSDFGDNDSIELRLAQDLDSDNDTNDN